MPATRLLQANGIDICVEEWGDPRDPTLLLVMGLGVQLISWEAEFVQMFVDGGLHVVRFDNRDAGLSTRFDGHVADVRAAIAGDTSSAAYTLTDMAADAVGVLDGLGIRSAHVAGTSMGGMIAQTLAIEHPDRVLSLGSIMSTTGERAVARPTDAAREALLAPTPPDRDGVIEVAVTRARALAGAAFPFDEQMIRDRAAAAFDRADYPEGKTRQNVAVLASGDRTAALAGIRVPTVVIHGSDDPLVPLSAGEATAAAIPGARLVVIPGMGHEIPVAARPLVVSAVLDNIRLASRSGAAS